MLLPGVFCFVFVFLFLFLVVFVFVALLAQRLWTKAQLPFLSVFLYKLQSRHVFPGSPTLRLASQACLGESRTFSSFMEKVGLLFVLFICSLCFLFNFSSSLRCRLRPSVLLGTQVPRLLSTAAVYPVTAEVFFAL